MTGFSCSLAEQQKLTDNRWSSSENSSQTVYIERCCFVRHFVQLLPCCRLRRDHPCDEEPSFQCSCVPCIPFNLLFICRVNSRCSVKASSPEQNSQDYTTQNSQNWLKLRWRFANVQCTPTTSSGNCISPKKEEAYWILNHCGHLWPPTRFTREEEETVWQK